MPPGRLGAIPAVRDAPAHVLRFDADVDLTRTFDREQFSRGLASWDWIGVGRRVPMYTSLFGDVFFESYDGYWWLDTVRGRLTRPWEGLDELEADLDSSQGQRRYLRAGLALDAELRGLLPGPGTVYGFTVAPIVGGAMAVENLELMDFSLRLHLAGQLHGWVREGRSHSPR